MKPIRSHRELDVYKRALWAAVALIELTKRFPAEERWEMVVQLRSSSRSVCSCVAEAFRKRNYPAAFASKITEAENEAAETQTWLDLALAHGYITRDEHGEMIQEYETVLGQLVNLRLSAAKWTKSLGRSS